MGKIILLIVLVAMVWWAFSTLEARSLYFPDKQIAATPAVYKLEYEDVRLRTGDGTDIQGWFIPAAKPGKTSLTLLMAHGNAGNISHRLDKALIWHHLGLNVLLFDYRGYGQSGGKPSENGTYLDAEAVYTYLTQTRGLSPRSLLYYGESLGCAVAVELAQRHPAAGLILESPFTSTIAIGKRIYPWLPVQWMVRYRYDNLLKISTIHMPLLILHSRQDEIVPFAMGQQLFAAAPGPKTFFELSGGHNDGYEVTGKPYVEAIAAFLKTI